MATQQEVAEAFASFDASPWSASNFKMHVMSDNYTAYLCGGRGGEHVVFAKREPLEQFRAYESRIGMPYGGMMYSAMRDQHRVMYRALRHAADEYEVEWIDDTPKRLTEEDFPELYNEIHG